MGTHNIITCTKCGTESYPLKIKVDDVEELEDFNENDDSLDVKFAPKFNINFMKNLRYKLNYDALYQVARDIESKLLNKQGIVLNIPQFVGEEEWANQNFLVKLHH